MVQMQKILIIDDDTKLTDIYKEVLTQAGFTVAVANDPKTAIEKIVAEAPNLILLDVLMPEISGLELLDNIKNNESVKGIPIVFLTNLRDDDTIKQGLAKGAIGYLMKTELTPGQVVEEVKLFLSQTSPIS